MPHFTSDVSRLNMHMRSAQCTYIKWTLLPPYHLLHPLAERTHIMCNCVIISLSAITLIAYMFAVIRAARVNGWTRGNDFYIVQRDERYAAMADFPARKFLVLIWKLERGEDYTNDILWHVGNSFWRAGGGGLCYSLSYEFISPHEYEPRKTYRIANTQHFTQKRFFGWKIN